MHTLASHASRLPPSFFERRLKRLGRGLGRRVRLLHLDPLGPLRFQLLPQPLQRLVALLNLLQGGACAKQAGGGPLRFIADAMLRAGTCKALA